MRRATNAGSGAVERTVRVSRAARERRVGAVSGALLKVNTSGRSQLRPCSAGPGVTPTILGARTLQQLDDNLAAIDVKLGAEQVARLDALTKPKLNFPADFLHMAGMIQAGGTTINGEPSQLSPFGVTEAGDHY